MNMRYDGEVAKDASTGAGGAPEAGAAPCRGLEVTLLSQCAMLAKCMLPLPAEGRLELARLPALHFEAVRDGWEVRGDRHTRMVDEQGVDTDRLPLRDGDLLRLTVHRHNYRLYVRALWPNSTLLHNYAALARTEIRIGRAEDNDIIVDNRFASRHHARLVFTGRAWRLQDVGSTHGVYVSAAAALEVGGWGDLTGGQDAAGDATLGAINGTGARDVADGLAARPEDVGGADELVRARTAELHAGDRFELPGLRAVIGCGFFSLADGEGRLRINRENLRRVDEASQVFSTARASASEVAVTQFNRFPRSRLAFEPRDIEIETPPVFMGGEQLPMLMRLGSSMAMGGRAALTGNVAMLAGSVFLPILTQQYTKEEREAYEQLRTQRYRAYLDAKWNEIQDEKEREEAVLAANYPPLTEVLGYALREGDAAANHRKLWERRKTDDDFLTLRLGNGSIPLPQRSRPPSATLSWNWTRCWTRCTIWRSARSGWKTRRSCWT